MKYKKEAKEIMDKIDKKDSVFIASALFLDCGIWFDDKDFQKQNKVDIYTTRDILNICEFLNK